MNKALWEFATLLLKMFFVLFLKAIFSKDFACVEAENLGAFLGGIFFLFVFLLLHLLLRKQLIHWYIKNNFCVKMGVQSLFLRTRTVSAPRFGVQ